MKEENLDVDDIKFAHFSCETMQKMILVLFEEMEKREDIRKKYGGGSIILITASLAEHISFMISSATTFTQQEIIDDIFKDVKRLHSARLDDE